MTKLERKIAARYLRHRKASKLVSLITLIATGGVTVGVMALVVVIGVMTGLQNELRDRIFTASPHLRVLTYGTGLRVDNWREALDSIRQHPDVIAAAPFVNTQGLITAGADHTEGIVIIGLPADTGTASVTPLPSFFLRGDPHDPPALDDVESSIILGYRVANRFSVLPGDRVQIISSAGTRFNRAVGGFIPRVLAFEVAGDFETGMYDYDNNYAVLPLHAAQTFAQLDSAVSGLEVRVRDPWDAPQVGEELVEALGYPFRYVDWQTQNASLFAALALEKLGMGLVLLLIVIVAAFNIVSTLTMVVTDKTKEIGILRAMGLSAPAVRRVFMLQGAFIGLTGTTLGAVLGLIVGRLVDNSRLIELDPSVYFVDHLPVQIQTGDFLTIVMASVAVAIFATLLPAKQAAQLVPVEAIRHE